MLPMLAAAAATAAAQYYMNQQNQKANQSLMDQEQDRINGIGLPQLNESDFMSPEISKSLDPSMLNYNQYQSAGDYSPTSGGYVQEKDPTLVQDSADAKFGRNAQIEALKKFQQNIQSGYDPAFAAKMDQANQQGQSSAQSRMNSIMQDAQRRGQGGSLATLAAQMQGSSDAMSRSAQASQQAAVSSYQNLLNQQMQAGNMGRQLASDEESLAGRNADIVNSFNQRSSRSYQNYLDQQNEMQNQAQMRNLSNKQSLSNQNTALGNQQTSDQYKAANAERSYQNQLMQQRQGVRQSNFSNAMSKATGQNMLSGQQMGMNNQNAQAQAGMIQGVGQGFAGYYAGEDAKQARADDRAYQTDQASQNRSMMRDIAQQNQQKYGQSPDYTPYPYKNTGI